MMSAAITPGIQPRQVRIKTIRKEPQPLSTTASGGNMMARITLRRDISLRFSQGTNIGNFPLQKRTEIRNFAVHENNAWFFTGKVLIKHPCKTPL